MAESGLVKDLHDNFLQCAICMEGYKSPRMLPCMHSFCLNCLEKLAKSPRNKPLSCPSCRATVTIPETGLKDLPSNFLLVSLMERLNLADTRESTSSSKCSFCDGIQNIQRCVDCSMYVCVTCKQCHDRMPEFRDHRVIPIDKSLKSNDRIHKKPKKPKTRVNISAKQNLEPAIQNSEKLVISVQQIKANVNAATTSLGQEIAKCEQKVDEQYNQVSKRLKADRNKLKEKLKMIKTQQFTLLKEIEDEATSWTEAMENTQLEAKKIMKGKNQSDKNGMEKDITDAFKKLHDDEISLNNKNVLVQEVSNTKITFFPSVISVSNSASRMATSVTGNLPGNVKQHPHQTPHLYYTGNYYGGVNNSGPWIPPSTMSVSTSASQMSNLVNENVPGNVYQPPHQTPHLYYTGNYYGGVNSSGPWIPPSAMSVSTSASQMSNLVNENVPGNVYQPPHQTPHLYYTGNYYGGVNSSGPWIPPSAKSVSTSASQTATPERRNLSDNVKQHPHQTPHLYYTGNYYGGVNSSGPWIPPSTKSVSTLASQMSTPVNENLLGTVKQSSH